MKCEWISIHTFPPLDYPILVTDGNKILLARLNEIRRTTTKEADSTDLDFLEGASGYDNLWITPTHWMRLPDLPKK